MVKDKHDIEDYIDEPVEFKRFARVILLEERMNNMEGQLFRMLEDVRNSLEKIQEELAQMRKDYENRITILETKDDQYVKKTECEESKRLMESRISKLEDEVHNFRSEIDAKTKQSHWNFTLVVSLVSLLLTILLIFDLILRWKGL